MMSILCRLGWHDWTNFIEKKDDGWRETYEMCEKCKKRRFEFMEKRLDTSWIDKDIQTCDAMLDLIKSLKAGEPETNHENNFYNCMKEAVKTRKHVHAGYWRGTPIYIHAKKEESEK